MLIGPGHSPAASGDYTWENRLENGYWTYGLADAWAGVQAAFAALAADVQARYGLPLATVGAMGISGMMHGYLPFDARGRQLAAFRTWRNTCTGPAAGALTALLGFNIPQRWSIAHLYQAVLNGEEHVGRIAFLTTLAGYIHWQLTGEKVLGVGEASGMFPIAPDGRDYDAARLQTVQAELAARGAALDLRAILPKVLPAGAAAGRLTPQGARLLDPTGTLQPGIPFCPPEGDAGTGMAATNSVAARTGNVSAGTSVFAMVVLEHPLKAVHPELDLVTTPQRPPGGHGPREHLHLRPGRLGGAAGPDGRGHRQAAAPGRAVLAVLPAGAGRPGRRRRADQLQLLFRRAGAGAGGGLPAAGPPPGCAADAAQPGPQRAVRRHGRAENRHGHPAEGRGRAAGPPAGPRRPVQGAGGRAETAGRCAGGACLGDADRRRGRPLGMALLAAYLAEKADGEPLEDYLARVFAGAEGSTILPDAADSEGFGRFLAGYRRALPAERAAARALLE